MDALNLLAKISDHWELLGVALKTSEATLDKLRANQKMVRQLKLLRLLEEWKRVQRTRVTWSVIVNALESDLLEHHETAKAIKEKLAKPELYYKYVVLPDFVSSSDR